MGQMFFPGEKEVEVTFEKIHLEYDIFQGGKKGMRINVTFVIDSARNNPCQLFAHFYFEDGTAIKYGCDPYSSVKGHLLSAVDFTPPYECTRFTDLQIFLPYETLPQSTVYYTKISILVNGKWFTKDKKYYFTFKRTSGNDERSILAKIIDALF